MKDFGQLIGGEIKFVVSRGNVIHVKFDKGMILVLGSEYGDKIFCMVSMAKLRLGT